MRITQISNGEYAPYYENYIKIIDDTWTLTEALEVSLHEFIKFVQDIPMDKHNYRYAEGKWTIKEIIQHLIDTERVFTYRALRFSRGDTTELPGYDQDSYVSNTDADSRSLQSLLTEISALRHATLLLFKSFNDDDLLKRGVASGYTVSVRAFGFMIVGHEKHHIKIFKERYL